MNPILLESITQIDLEKECGISYLTSIENCFPDLHYHDFYELLLITHGKLTNEVSGTVMLLEKGSLVYFRPKDIHQLKQYRNEDCHFINLTFTAEVVKELFRYMGEELETTEFARCPLPPVLTLPESQAAEVANRWNRLNTLPVTDKKLIRSTLRMLLMEMYFHYLPLIRREKENPLPYWLEKLCADMQEKEVFTVGLPELVRLTGKNHSYLCRAFQKHLGCTPTAHLNKIRLNYAENLLLNSDLSILDICLETGFDSLSHFYRLFEGQYGMTPNKYRKMHWTSVHRWSNISQRGTVLF